MVHITPQPLYNTIVGVQYNFRVGYPNHVIMRVKYIDTVYSKIRPFGVHKWSVLYPKPCCNEACYKEVQAQHAHSRTTVRNSRTETALHAQITCRLRAKTCMKK